MTGLTGYGLTYGVFCREDAAFTDPPRSWPGLAKHYPTCLGSDALLHRCYDTDTWTWSDTVAKMHGYEPDEVQPTTELVLSHKHPDDLAHVKALLKQSSAPFSSRHRIRTATGETRKVVVVGAAVTDPSGRTVATRGFYIDITEAFHADLQQEVGDELQVIVAHGK
jgi:PAS domain S-box-containing protein